MHYLWLYLSLSILMAIVPTANAQDSTSSAISSNSQDSKLAEQRLAANLISRPQLAKQRHRYGQALQYIKKKQFDAYHKTADQLKDYPLYPYLRYRYYLAKPGQLSPKIIQQFEKKYQSQRWSNYLLNTYLRELAQQKKHRAFIKHYQASINDNQLACIYADILHKKGKKKQAYQVTSELWQRPYSMPKECDRVFSLLIKEQGISSAAGLKRFIAAYEKGEKELVKYLRRFLSPEDQHFADLLLATQANTNNVKKYWPSFKKRLLDPKQAQWHTLIFSRLKSFLRNEKNQPITFINKQLRPWAKASAAPHIRQFWQDSVDYLILRQALNDLNKVPKLYLKLGKPNSELAQEWLARAYMHRAEWKKLHQFILQNFKQNSADFKNQAVWQYWFARSAALAKIPSAEAQQLFFNLSQETSYYGYAAASHRDSVKMLSPKKATITTNDIEVLINNTAFSRAIEFYYHQEKNQAQVEWQKGLSTLNEKQIVVAAYLAHYLGWHNQAIATVAKVKAWKHYYIRFPDFQREQFSFQASKYNLPPAWLYATARQESGLNRSAKSSAGALGLMQIMPATAKQEAQFLRQPYSSHLLHEPAYNISIGSAYLAKMHHTFNNKALASAAYNAVLMRRGNT